MQGRHKNNPDTALFLAVDPHSGAVLVVALAGKGAAGFEFHRVDPGDFGPVLIHAMGRGGQWLAAWRGRSARKNEQSRAA